MVSFQTGLIWIEEHLALDKGVRTTTQIQNNTVWHSYAFSAATLHATTEEEATAMAALEDKKFRRAQ